MDTYKTSDIYLVAALLSSGAALDYIDTSNKKRFVFTLRGEGSVDFSQVERAWYSGNLNGNFCAFRDALRFLKSKIHS